MALTHSIHAMVSTWLFSTSGQMVIATSLHVYQTGDITQGTLSMVSFLHFMAHIYILNTFTIHIYCLFICFKGYEYLDMLYKKGLLTLTPSLCNDDR